MSAIKLVCANAKGGVAKTTTCFQVAGFLAKEWGKKVLCIDADPQANLSVVLGVNINTLEKNLAHVITNIHPAAECVINVLPNLDLLPATLQLDSAQRRPELFGVKRPEMVMKLRLGEITEQYDFILIDTASSATITPLTKASLVFADRVIVPVVPNSLDVMGIGTVLGIINDIRRQMLNENLDILAIVSTMVQRRVTEHARQWADVLQVYPDYAATTQIRANSKVAASLSARTPICAFDRRCHGYEDYRNLTDEFLTRLGAVVHA